MPLPNGVISRGLNDKLGEQPSVKAWGPYTGFAVADGTNKILSDAFASLALSQSRYPFATSQTQSVDWATITLAMQNHDGLTLPKGQYFVNENLDIPEDVSLRFLGNAVLNTVAGKIVTVNGHIEAQPRQIFKGGGRIRFANGGVEKVFTEWWGAKVTGQLKPFTVTGNTLVTPKQHGFLVDSQVRITGSVPGGISVVITYFVISALLTKTAFQVSLTAGGSPVTLSSIGTPGSQWVNSQTHCAPAHQAACDCGGYLMPFAVTGNSLTTSPVGHGLTINDPFQVSSVGGLVPGALTAGATYYPATAGLTDTQFQVSLTPGGSPISLTTAGSGAMTIKQINLDIGAVNIQLLAGQYYYDLHAGEKGLVLTKSGIYLFGAGSAAKVTTRITYNGLFDGNVIYMGGTVVQAPSGLNGFEINSEANTSNPLATHVYQYQTNGVTIEDMWSNGGFQAFSWKDGQDNQAIKCEAELAALNGFVVDNCGIFSIKQCRTFECGFGVVFKNFRQRGGISNGYTKSLEGHSDFNSLNPLKCDNDYDVLVTDFNSDGTYLEQLPYGRPLTQRSIQIVNACQRITINGYKLVGAKRYGVQVQGSSDCTFSDGTITNVANGTPFTVSGNFLVSNLHGLILGHVFRLFVGPGGALPGGLSVNTDYYISTTSDPNQFEVATNPAGTSIISLSSAGTSPMYWLEVVESTAFTTDQQCKNVQSFGLNIQNCGGSGLKVACASGLFVGNHVTDTGLRSNATITQNALEIASDETDSAGMLTVLHSQLVNNNGPRGFGFKVTSARNFFADYARADGFGTPFTESIPSLTVHNRNYGAGCFFGPRVLFNGPFSVASKFGVNLEIDGTTKLPKWLDNIQLRILANQNLAFKSVAGKVTIAAYDDTGTTPKPIDLSTSAFTVNGASLGAASSDATKLQSRDIDPVAPSADKQNLSWIAATSKWTPHTTNFTELAGTLAATQMPVGNISVTVSLAKLTTGGSFGSISVVSGVITAYTPPT